MYAVVDPGEGSGGPNTSLIFLKKIAEGKKASRGNKTECSPPPPPLSLRSGSTTGMGSPHAIKMAVVAVFN